MTLGRKRGKSRHCSEGGGDEVAAVMVVVGVGVVAALALTVVVAAEVTTMDAKTLLR